MAAEAQPGENETRVIEGRLEWWYDGPQVVDSFGHDRLEEALEGHDGRLLRITVEVIG